MREHEKREKKRPYIDNSIIGYSNKASSLTSIKNDFKKVLDELALLTHRSRI